MFRSIGDYLETLPIFPAVRRNHALEHATVHMLSRRQSRLKLAGYSIPGGFLIIGHVATEQLQAAAEEALDRLTRGEGQWALHPNCGTSLLTTGVMASLAAMAAEQLTRRPEERPLRLPTSIMFIIASMLVARPLGLILQRDITTEANMGGLRIEGVRQLSATPVPVHWVSTRLP